MYGPMGGQLGTDLGADSGVPYLVLLQLTGHLKANIYKAASVSLQYKVMAMKTPGRSTTEHS